MSKKELKAELKQVEEEMEDWKGINRYIWRRKYSRRKEILKELKEYEKPKKVIKKSKVSEYKCKFCGKKYKGKRGLKTHLRYCKKTPDDFDPADINKDGKVDFKDVVAIAKKAIGK